MDITKIVALIKQFETAEPAVIAEVKSIYDTFGPSLATAFPSLAGAEKEVGFVLDFLSNANGRVFPLIDKALALLSSIKLP